MRKIRCAILFLSGCFLIFFAVFAFELGLDPTPNWGRSRILAFSLGTLLMVVFADMRFGPAWTEKTLGRIDTWFVGFWTKLFDRLPLPKALQQGNSQHVRNRLIYVSAFFSSFVIIGIYVWFATAGTWIKWPAPSSYYDWLANSFVQGKVSLDVKVDPKLLTLPDPFDFASRTQNGVRYLWDASLYDGKYYLYWGPIPAIILAAIKIIHPMGISDLIIAFVAAVGLLVFQTILITRIWLHFFQRLPVWTLILGIFLAGLVVPITWMINRPKIYEASVLSAQLFLMGGVYFAYIAFEKDEISAGWLALASTFWVCAIASRTIIVFAIIFFVFFILAGVIRKHGITWTFHFNALILALGIPMMLGAIGLGWYNFARFGSVFEFGLKYQLTSNNIYKNGNRLFSSQYITANIYNYLLNPPKEIRPFPYFRATDGVDDEAFGLPIPELYYAEKVTGAVYVLPFMAFAFFPIMKVITKKISRKQDAHGAGWNLDWLSLALCGGIIVEVASMLLFFYATMRYFADVTPMLILLAIVGFWTGYRAVQSDRFVRFVYAGVGIPLAGLSVIVPTALALLSSQRINEYSPQTLPALDALFRSIFSS